MTLNFNELNTWDYQWHFTHWKYGWKSLHFNINMSINIGFDNRATHTSTMLNTDILLSDVVFSSIPLDKKIKRDYFSSIWYHDHMISARIFGIPDFIFRPHKFIYTILPVKVQTSISKFCNLK